MHPAEGAGFEDKSHGLRRLRVNVNLSVDREIHAKETLANHGP